jgi:uncharacterized protein YbjT (DUF2867 family)
VRVVVLGAAGQTGRLVVDRLVAAGHDVLGAVRQQAQADDLHRRGASAVLTDLTQVAATEIRPVLEDADAVVWAAAAGFGNDPAAVDAEACIHVQRAADEVGVGRWVQISSMYADRPDVGPPFLQPVLHAKNRSDVALADSGLGWTIIRPGGLTNDRGTGRVDLGHNLAAGTVPRADVAAVVAACVDDPTTARRAFDLVSGDTPIGDALGALAE